MNNISDGLLISAAGLVVAFAFMGIFILTMVVLQKLFPVKKATTPVAVFEAEPAEAVLMEPGSTVPVAEVDEELAVVAAITAAIQVVRAKRMSTLGAGLESGRGVWWVANQMTARQNSDLLRKSVR